MRQPLGVIAGIAPFNAPFLAVMKKVVRPGAAGNGFILKPSELTPVTGLKIAEVFDEAGYEPIFDEFCERFVAVANSLKVGDPREPDTVIGPLIRGTQCAVIDGHVEDAVGKGAKLLCGAKHEAQYYWPTVLSGVTREMRIFREE